MEGEEITEYMGMVLMPPARSIEVGACLREGCPEKNCAEGCVQEEQIKTRGVVPLFLWDAPRFLQSGDDSFGVIAIRARGDEGVTFTEEEFALRGAT